MIPLSALALFVIAAISTALCGGAIDIEMLDRMCHPDVIRALGVDIAAAASDGNDGGAATNRNKSNCKWNWLASCIPTGSKITPAKNVHSLDQKGAIRFALRKYFCDQLSTEDGANDWKAAGIELQARNDVKSLLDSEQLVARHERTFKRFDPAFPHNYERDFQFRVFYPATFNALWDHFQIGIVDLLESLTFFKLEGFENPAKGGSTFYTTKDGKYFMKTVHTPPNAPILLDSAVSVLDLSTEMNFFFKQNNDNDFVYWMEAEREESARFRGAFIDYFREMQQRKQSSFLPKFFLLFSFQPIVTRMSIINDRPEFTLFTIQNGLLPLGVPPIDLKFDLKGSSRLLRQVEVNKKLAKKGQITWKELNLIQHSANNQFTQGFFPNGIMLEEDIWKEVNDTLHKDAQFLLEHNIIDYSLLLGVHFEPRGWKKISRKYLHNSNNIRYPGLSATCTNCHKFQPGKKSDSKEGRTKVLQLFMGIIDVLQPYGNRKQLESMGKQLANNIARNNNNLAFPMLHRYKYKVISVVEPTEYRNRFLDFLTEIVFRAAEVAEEKEKEEEEEET